MESNKPFLAVFLIQTIYTGMFLLSKAAFNVGMNNFIFTFYRQAMATIFLAPFAIFLEWKNAPPLSLKLFCQIFVVSFLGITLSLDLYGIGVIYTSASLGAATTNCLPVITFIFAVIFRLEAWKIKTVPGIAKLVGMVICIGGAITLALYNGPSFKLFTHLHHHYAQHHQQAHNNQSHIGIAWIKGCFILLSGNAFWGLWLVMQARMMKGYPSKLLFTTLSCLLSSIQAFGIAIAVERNPTQWMLGWDVRLVAVAYCGIVVTGVTFCLQAYVIEKKGPVYLALWTPLALILTIVSSAILLGEIITLGRILGGILLVGGLYCVLWAKTQEQRITPANRSSSIEVGKEDIDLKNMEEYKNPTSLV